MLRLDDTMLRYCLVEEEIPELWVVPGIKGSALVLHRYTLHTIVDDMERWRAEDVGEEIPKTLLALFRLKIA